MSIMKYHLSILSSLTTASDVSSNQNTPPQSDNLKNNKITRTANASLNVTAMSSSSRPKYTHDLPAFVVANVVALLDQGDAWRALAVHGYKWDNLVIARLEQGAKRVNGPSHAASLMAKLDMANTTVDAFYSKLFEMEYYQVGKAIKMKWRR